MSEALTAEDGRIASIGRVANAVHDMVDENWGAVESWIEVKPDYAKGLRGLDAFSHAVIVFWMHRSDFDGAKDLVRRPRGRADMPEVGIFAQRAKHRPNPIGITAVELLAVEETRLKVRGLDAVNGTPVLDIKPYVPVYDRVEQARTPAWIQELMKGYF